LQKAEINLGFLLHLNFGFEKQRKTFKIRLILLRKCKKVRSRSLQNDILLKFENPDWA
jgi:hypothetical protein